MPLYDPKGTRWASYTTTQHGPTPVTAAAAARSVKGRVAVAAIDKKQQEWHSSASAAKGRRAGPPSLVAEALRALADGRYWSASRALQKAAVEAASPGCDARMSASSVPCPACDKAGWVGAETAQTTRRVGSVEPAIKKIDGDQMGTVGNGPGGKEWAVAPDENPAMQQSGQKNVGAKNAAKSGCNESSAKDSKSTSINGAKSSVNKGVVLPNGTRTGRIMAYEDAVTGLGGLRLPPPWILSEALTGWISAPPDFVKRLPRWILG